MNQRELADPGLVGEMAAMMRLLGDPTRMRMLTMLRVGEMNVSALCGVLDLAQPTVSHHLGLLRCAGLLLTRRQGKQVHYSLNPEHVTTMLEIDGLQLSIGQVNLCFASCPLNGAASAH